MLKQLYLSYLKKLLIFTALIMLIEICCVYFFPTMISKNTIYLIIFFLLVTAVSHYVILQTDVKRIEYKPDPEKSKEEQLKELMSIERKFISQYMLVTTVKLLLFLTLLVVYALLFRDDILRFALNFLVLYVSYSLFEIIILKRPVFNTKK